MLDGGESNSSSSVAAECFGSSLNAALVSKKKKSKYKRRFSDDQIKSLETMFESENKLETRKKLQLARELGLHPRQVAIWFQNKRARWKSKQLERDYSLLRANYNTLVSQFETLKKEKQSLVAQLQKLNDVVEKTHNKEGHCCKEEEVSGSSTGRVSDYNGGAIKGEFDVKPRLSLEYGVGVLSDDDCGIKTDYLGLDEDDPELLSMVEPADSSLTSPEEWGSLESDGLLDQPATSYQWWDFWS